MEKKLGLSEILIVIAVWGGAIVAGFFANEFFIWVIGVIMAGIVSLATIDRSVPSQKDETREKSDE